MQTHSFEVKAEWKGGLQGKGLIQGAGFEIPYSAPKALKGLGEGTNPEELLGGAAAGCYLITLGVILSCQNVKVQSLTVSSRMEVVGEGSLKILSLHHYPRLVVQGPVTEEQRTKLGAAFNRAEQMCMVGNAIRGGLEVHITPELIVE